MAKFLSDDWFAKVDELTQAAGDLQIPKALREVVVNLTVGTDTGDVQMCMNGGLIQRGNVPKADVDMSMPADYAYRILIKGDWSAGMKGWLVRKIKLTGNMRKMMPLKTHKPSAPQEDLRKKIDGITDPM
ncbi:MAG: hypothetical protein PHY31_04880 [Smithellaceae bacterium]|nr:hypothetical protein [Smithellaceae bacterium]